MHNMLITMQKLYVKQDLHRPRSRTLKGLDQLLMAYSDIECYAFRTIGEWSSPAMDGQRRLLIS